jgi:DNA repair protein RadA/Sms
MLLAVLTKRTKLKLGNHDIYTNIAGGIKIRETALDLAICLSVASSMLDTPLEDGVLAFGEVSLSGEIKPVVGQQKRINQAKKLGYKKFITSDTVQNINQALAQAFPNPKNGK